MLKFIRSDLNQLNAYIAPEEIISNRLIDRLDFNESPFDLPPELKEKLTWIYQNKIQSNRYPDGSHQVLKQEIANYVNEAAALQKTITEKFISVGNGSDELIRSILIATCLGNEGSILVANPTFSMYAILAKTLGISVVNVERNIQDFSINITQANQTISSDNNPSIRVIFLVHPNSPTANALTPAELDWLRSIPPSILVVIDEAYFEFSQTTVVAELNQHPNWVILRTFSKAFRLATHRVGYAIAHPEVIAVLEKIRLPFNLPSLSLEAALIAMQHRSLILPAVNKIIQERARLERSLGQLPGIKIWPSQANFIYLRLHDGKEEELSQVLLEKGTQIRHTGGGLRITVGTPEENERTILRLTEYQKRGKFSESDTIG